MESQVIFAKAKKGRMKWLGLVEGTPARRFPQKLLNGKPGWQEFEEALHLDGWMTPSGWSEKAAERIGKIY